MHRCEVHHNPGMALEPETDLFAVMHTEIVTDQVDRFDSRRPFVLQSFQEGHKLDLALTPVTAAIDLAGARVEPGKQINSARPPIFMFDLIGQTGQRRSRVFQAGPRLERGLLINTEHDFVLEQGTGVQVYNLGHASIERFVAGLVRREPHMTAPGFEGVMRKNPADRLRGDGIDQTIALQLQRQLGAIPLRQGTTELIRAFTGQLDQMHRHFRGKKQTGDRGPLCHRVPEDALFQSG